MSLNNYSYHLLTTMWRKKSSILICVALIVLLFFGLEYMQPDFIKYNNKDVNSEFVTELQQNERTRVQFLEAYEKKMAKIEASRTDNHEQHVHDEGLARNDNLDKQVEQQLGIPFVNLNKVKPFIPTERLVHFDLKGAPFLVNFYKKLFPLLKVMGATGILLEYEDMFPFDGVLKSIKAKNAYTIDDVKTILHFAAESHLDVIPLVQTFGHVEFALKHSEWTHIREVPGSPQALCPSRNQSLDFVTEIITQVMAVHPNVKYIHVGCDEVYQMGECQFCRLETHENLFLRHVKNVAKIVHERYPTLKIIIWDDMLRHLSQQTMLDMRLGDIVEPMVWVYAEDIYRFVQPQVWEKYAAVFKSAWAASAFKGAFGETLFIPDARRHLENNLRWLDVMSQQAPFFKRGFRGIVITGWQRYDHFAVLCELFPAALPSLALNLIAISNGYFNSTMKSALLSALSCPQQQYAIRTAPFINLDTDPRLWDKLGRCMFPGSPIFRLMYRLHSAEAEAIDYLRATKHSRGWMTDYNVRRNYSLPLRVDELVGDLPRVYHGLTSLMRSSYDAMVEVFDQYTIAEWIEQKIYPYVIEIERVQNESNALRGVNVWPSRPLPPLKDLQRLGVPVT